VCSSDLLTTQVGIGIDKSGDAFFAKCAKQPVTTNARSPNIKFLHRYSPLDEFVKLLHTSLLKSAEKVDSIPFGLLQGISMPTAVIMMQGNNAWLW